MVVYSLFKDTINYNKNGINEFKERIKTNLKKCKDFKKNGCEPMEMIFKNHVFHEAKKIKEWKQENKRLKKIYNIKYRSKEKNIGISEEEQKMWLTFIFEKMEQKKF